MTITRADNTSEKCLPFIDEAHNTLKMKWDSDTYMELIFPFSVNKIKPAYRDVNAELEHVFIFKNNEFNEFDICEIKRKSEDGYKVCGVLFRPSMLFNPDSKYLYKDDKFLMTILYRGLLMAINDKSSAPSNPQKINDNLDCELFDLFPKDVIIGVFPFELNQGFNESELTQLLLNLNLYSFNFVNNQDDLNFKPPYSLFRKEQYESLGDKNKKRMNIALIPAIVKSNKYCQTFIKELIKSSENELTKFYQLYGLVEILKDEVLKREIQEKVCGGEIQSGYKLSELVHEIARDAYSVNKFFSKYSSIAPDTVSNVEYDIYAFLDKCRNKDEIKDLYKFPQLYYFLRNILVHDIQFLFTHESISHKDLRVQLMKVVESIECIMIESLCSTKFS